MIQIANLFCICSNLDKYAGPTSSFINQKFRIICYSLFSRVFGLFFIQSFFNMRSSHENLFLLFKRNSLIIRHIVIKGLYFFRMFRPLSIGFLFCQQLLRYYMQWLTKMDKDYNLNATVLHTLRTRKRNRGPGGVIFILSVFLTELPDHPPRFYALFNLR